MTPLICRRSSPKRIGPDDNDSTTRQALTDIAQVQPGQRVLIHGGGGGVGHVADEVIDYQAVDFAAVISDIDVAFKYFQPEA